MFDASQQSQAAVTVNLNTIVPPPPYTAEQINQFRMAGTPQQAIDALNRRHEQMRANIQNTINTPLRPTTITSQTPRTLDRRDQNPKPRVGGILDINKSRVKHGHEVPTLELLQFPLMFCTEDP